MGCLCRIGLGPEQLGEIPAAINAYQRALDVLPNTSSYHNLGHCYEELDQWQNAADVYREAIKLREDDPELHQHLGDVQRRMGRYDQAKLSLREGSHFEP